MQLPRQANGCPGLLIRFPTHSMPTAAWIAMDRRMGQVRADTMAASPPRARASTSARLPSAQYCM